MSPIEIAAYVATAALCVWAVVDWRRAMIACLVYGFGIDILRKVIPGQPVYLSALVVVPILACLVGVWWAGEPVSIRRIFRRSPRLAPPVVLFALLVLVQSIAGYARTGSLIIMAIGMLAYLAPFPGFILGFNYGRGTEDYSHLFRWYSGLVVVLAAGILLAKMGVSWKVLDSVGLDLYAFAPSGGILYLKSGFFRAAEIAAWHTGLGICLVLLLAFTRKRNVIVPALLAGLVPFLAMNLMFTGRRKAIVLVLLFLAVYTALVVYFRRGASRVAVVIGGLSLAAFVLLFFTGVGDRVGIDPYLERGMNVGTAETERVQRNAFDSVVNVVRANGVFGAGAGTGSQGAQYFGGGQQIVGAAAEGGIAKIVAELGLPGLVLLVWIVFAAGLRMWEIASIASRGGVRRARYTFGLIGLLVGNGLIFTIGHQVFGDPFVLFVLGLLAGLLLTIPTVVEGRVVSRGPVGFPESAERPPARGRGNWVGGIAGTARPRP